MMTSAVRRLSLALALLAVLAVAPMSGADTTITTPYEDGWRYIFQAGFIPWATSEGAWRLSVSGQYEIPPSQEGAEITYNAYLYDDDYMVNQISFYEDGVVDGGGFFNCKLWLYNQGPNGDNVHLTIDIFVNGVFTATTDFHGTLMMYGDREP